MSRSLRNIGLCGTYEEIASYLKILEDQEIEYTIDGYTIQDSDLEYIFIDRYIVNISDEELLIFKLKIGNSYIT